jgi:hypothetical protein
MVAFVFDKRDQPFLGKLTMWWVDLRLIHRQDASHGYLPGEIVPVLGAEKSTV